MKTLLNIFFYLNTLTKLWGIRNFNQFVESLNSRWNLFLGRDIHLILLNLSFNYRSTPFILVFTILPSISSNKQNQIKPFYFGVMN